MNKLVSVAIVNWNGEKYLYKCIDSLLNQNYKNIEIIIIDNDSTDSSVKIIEDNFKEKVVLFKNKNTGYAGGANKGIELSNGEYVIIANPDIVFGENYIEKCINKFSEDEEELLLNIYFNGKLEEKYQKRILINKIYQDFLWSTWTIIKEAKGDDFGTYGIDRYTRAKKNLEVILKEEV